MHLHAIGLVLRLCDDDVAGELERQVDVDELTRAASLNAYGASGDRRRHMERQASEREDE
jgi:hypothetical protein